MSKSRTAKEQVYSDTGEFELRLAKYHADARHVEQKSIFFMTNEPYNTSDMRDARKELAARNVSTFFIFDFIDP